VDPVRVAEGRSLGDELTIHFGLLPRSNRGIFCINELPDLTEKVQVGLFNVMQERDVQVKGYRVRAARRWWSPVRTRRITRAAVASSRR
jgi:magnesium chelatase subunit I